MEKRGISFKPVEHPENINFDDILIFQQKIDKMPTQNIRSLISKYIFNSHQYGGIYLTNVY
jgi:hypothetical protein